VQASAFATARKLGNCQMTQALGVIGGGTGRTIHRACGCPDKKEPCSCPKIHRSAVGPAPAGVPVSSPSDAREREAESVASRVMSMREPAAGPLATPASASMASVATGGQPLSTATRAWFEPRLGHDLSSVRLHVGAEAERSAESLNARAYTVGRDIVFGAGQYAPDTDEGRHLLAHELAHVVQEGSGVGRMIYRQSCGHDAAKGPGCGTLQSEKDGDLVSVGFDRVIAAALGDKLGGTWIAQAYSPPNPTKSGLQYGLIDAMKVTADADLKLEVVEIKSRNTMMGTGGCGLATTEAQGYVSVLSPLAPRMAEISKGLETIGGLSLPNCRSYNKTVEAQLRKAGIDPDSEHDMFAWCVLNSIQNRLGTTFTKGFNKVTVSTNADGSPNTDYRALILPYPCKKKAKSGTGVYQLLFQVNQKGGISYRCEKECYAEDEEEKRKEKYPELPKTIEIPTGKTKQKFDDVNVIDEPDPNENVDIREPDTGLDVVDVALWSAAAIATAKGLQLARDKAISVAEKKAAEAALKRLAEEAERRGAAQIAKALAEKAEKEALKKAEEKVAQDLAKLGEKRLLKKLEEKLIEDAIKKATTEAEKKAAKTVAKKLAAKAAKKLAEKGPEAIPYIGAIIFVVVELGPIADAYAKGADIEFGFSGSDADLAGDTNVDIKGDKSKTDVVSDVKLDDSQIDVELGAPAKSTGIMELEAKKVSMKGKLPSQDGMNVTVNLTLKLDNTTIVYKSMGKMKGGKVVIDGALSIKDSTITIDIPADKDVDVKSQTDVKREIKGANITITDPGSGKGDAAAGKGDGKGKGDGAKTDEKTDETKEEAPPDPDLAEKTKLVGEISKDERLKQLYEKIFKKKGTPDLELLRRLAALKAQLDAHPELLEKLLGKIIEGEVKDPIKEIIEPLEQELANADKKVEEPKPDPGGTPGTPTTTTDDKKPDDKKPGATTTTTTTTPAANAPKPDDKKPKTTDGTPKAAPTEEEKAKATGIDFWSHKDKKVKGWEPEDKPAEYSPTGKLPVRLQVKTKSGMREYRVWIHGTFVDKRKADAGFEWMGNYNFAPPSGIFQSTVGDEPIYFTDAGTEQKMKYGYKPAAPTKKKK
jgi:hypothetical protein